MVTNSFDFPFDSFFAFFGFFIGAIANCISLFFTVAVAIMFVLTFFINKDYKNDIGNEVQTLKVLEDIRSLVKNTTNENQKKAMKYIQNLTKICKL